MTNKIKKNTIFLLGILIVTLNSCNNAKKQLPDFSSYEIDMVFDTTQLQMDCKMKVKWNNLSNTPVTEIPFIFQLDSAKSLVKKAMINHRNVNIQYTSKESHGFEGFIMKLNNSVKENETAIIEIDFKTQKNEYFRDRILFFSEDLPLLPYFENGNFIPHFQIHSNYNVSVTYPSEFEIATTGLVNDKNTITGLTTIQTTVREVPSYGVILFKDVIVKEITTTNNVLIRSIFFKDDEKWGINLLNYAQDIIQFYNDTLGFYPQPILNIIPGYDKPYGGWPICPNIVGVHRGIDLKKERAETHAKWIMAHEAGHQYWGFNYVLEPLDYPQWFGIAMGIYTDRIYSLKRNVDKNYNKSFFTSYIKGVSKGYNTTIMQKTDTLDKQGFDWNNVIMHGKSYAVLRMLAYELGEDIFFKIFKYCLDNYKGVNVTTEIFQNDCERISNKNLDTFFQQWFYSNDFLEYQIDEVNTEKKNNIYRINVKISKTGKADISVVEIGFILSSGETIIKTFDGRTKQDNIIQEFEYPIEKIILNPDFKLPLINKKDYKIKAITINRITYSKQAQNIKFNNYPNLRKI
ncbi:MAG: hypothetical protein K8R58_11830 [Bacteroidales bacterium]|nr:hypothetical protein [Bacteroidales bacterium]